MIIRNFSPGRLTALITTALLSLTTSSSEALTPTEVGKLRADDVVRGGDVAVDGTTAIAGAHRHGNGAAFVFMPSISGVWHQQAKLVAADGADGDEFGSSVALDGDTAVVGARFDVNQGTATGSVYVFTRGPSGWTQQAKLLPDDGAAFAEFGRAVAIDGDTIVVSAPDEDRGNGGGYAYVYRRSGNGWVQQAKLTPDDDSFGYFYSVSIDGDTIVVGCPSSAAADSSAFVFVRSGGAWSQQARLGIEPNDGSGLFGYAAAVSGDTVVVGAPTDETLGGGAAYVFGRVIGSWTQQAKLLPLRGFQSERFGSSVAVAGTRIVIGAPLDRHQGANSGSAYAFERAGESWVRQAKLLASDGEDGDQFGNEVAVSGATAIIGLSASNVPKNRGSAMVYSLISRSRLFSPGDLTGDDTPELAALTPAGDVVVTDASDSRLHQFSFSDLGDLMDAELIGDINANGSPELVVLGRAILYNVPDHLLIAEVRDLLTGELISSVSFTPGNTSFDLEVIPDQSGNGVPELAVQSRGGYNWARNRSIKVQVADALGTQEVRWITFTRFTRRPKDLEIYPDVDGNGSPELVVMGDYRDSSRSDPLEIIDLATNNLLKQVGMGSGWTLLEQMPIADFNGNGASEFAVLRANSGGAVNVRIRDALTRKQLRWVAFNPYLMPLHMLNIGDINGNGAEEIVVFGQRFDTASADSLRAQAAQIKDSRTTASLANVYFSRNILGHDLRTMPDVNGNGAPELVLLGRRQWDGQLVAVIKDLATRERVEVVEF